MQNMSQNGLKHVHSQLLPVTVHLFIWSVMPHHFLFPLTSTLRSHQSSLCYNLSFHSIHHVTLCSFPPTSPCPQCWSSPSFIPFHLLCSLRLSLVLALLVTWSFRLHLPILIITRARHCMPSLHHWHALTCLQPRVHIDPSCSTVSPTLLREFTCSWLIVTHHSHTCESLHSDTVSLFTHRIATVVLYIWLSLAPCTVP